VKELSHSLFCICRLHQSHSSFVSRGYHLPEQVSGSFHDYKYRLYYGDNKLELGFDNERNKGIIVILMILNYRIDLSALLN